MIVRAFITHKKAEEFVDCQDRFGVNNDTKSIAVSDGMGSTWQQKIWAQLLVGTFTNSNDWFPSHDTIKPLCNTWHQMVESFIQHLKETNAPNNIIYRNERNLAEGKSAGATFVGIRFEKNLWKGSVLGDSCLIEWDGGEAKFHTSQDVEAFDSFPDYFDSAELKQGKGNPKAISGTLDKGDYLFLVSDPFSDFLFEHYKQDDVVKYMQQLIKLSSHEDFEAVVDEWREKGMHNDDTTLIIVEPDDSDDFTIVALDDIDKLINEEKRELKSKEEKPIEQIVSPTSNESTESETIVVSIENKEKQESISVEQIELSSPSDSSNNEVIKKAIAIDNQQETHPVEEKDFLIDFLREYKKALQKKHPLLGNLKLKWTQKAISEAIRVMFENYSINTK